MHKGYQSLHSHRSETLNENKGPKKERKKKRKSRRINLSSSEKPIS